MSESKVWWNTNKYFTEKSVKVLLCKTFNKKSMTFIDIDHRFLYIFFYGRIYNWK